MNWMMRVVVVALLAGCGPKVDVAARCEAISKTSKVAATSEDWRYWDESCREWRAAHLTSEIESWEASRNSAAREVRLEEKVSFKCVAEIRKARERGYGDEFLSAACRAEYDAARKDYPTLR
jgi:hypothetical protein